MVENENKQPAGSRRMKILQQSLAKKQAAFDQRLQNHFDDVRSANGQPLKPKSLRRRIANLKNRHSRQKKGRLKRRRGNRRKPWKNVCW